MTHDHQPLMTDYANDLERLRAREYPWEARGDAIHFDHAAVGPLPQRARDALDAYGLKRAEPHRLGAEDFFPVLRFGGSLPLPPKLETPLVPYQSIMGSVPTLLPTVSTTSVSPS